MINITKLKKIRIIEKNEKKFSNNEKYEINCLTRI